MACHTDPPVLMLYCGAVPSPPSTVYSSAWRLVAVVAVCGGMVMDMAANSFSTLNYGNTFEYSSTVFVYRTPTTNKVVHLSDKLAKF